MQRASTVTITLARQPQHGSVTDRCTGVQQIGRGEHLACSKYSLLWLVSTDIDRKTPESTIVTDDLEVLVYLIFIPESPRYLIRHNKEDKALGVLAKYHANGQRDDELVQFEMNEIKHAIQLEEESKRTKYIDFVKTSGNRRRLLVIFTLATVSAIAEIMQHLPGRFTNIPFDL